MKGLALWFMVLGLISVSIGMGWGLYMAGTEDRLMAPAHAHLSLMGFVSFSIFAFYYHVVPGAGAGALPKLHFLLAVLGLSIAIPGIVLSKLGLTDALAAGGSFTFAVGMLCFLIVVLRGAHGR